MYIYAFFINGYLLCVHDKYRVHHGHIYTVSQCANRKLLDCKWMCQKSQVDACVVSCVLKASENREGDHNAQWGIPGCKLRTDYLKIWLKALRTVSKLYGNWTIIISSFLNRDKGSVTCTTQPPLSETRDDRPGGPTPLGEYLIGKRYTHSKHKIDWYNLYPKKEDNSGYYKYTDSTQKGRSTLALHPGTISEGCVTVKASTYNNDPCWQRIRKVIDSGNMQYRRSSYSGFLYVK